MRALTLHAQGYWTIAALVVVIGFPVAGFLIQAARVRRGRRDAADSGDDPG